MIEVFNRYEIKYLLDAEAAALLERRLSARLAPDAYCADGGYPVANLYFDTPDSELIRRSRAKPSYKEKLRLRAYGTPRPGDPVFIELKKKVAGLVNKRRSAIGLAEARDFVATGRAPSARPCHNPQVLSEVARLVALWPVAPVVHLSYDRMAWAASDCDLRVSMDANLRSRRRDLRLESGSYGRALLPAGTRILEVKTARAMPLWLARTLSELRAYPMGFSKYGREYELFCAERRLAGEARSATLGEVEDERRISA